ncbi:hypothetical protein F0562_016676 [Nyssa sinensis]|uniref:DC1 domain-containing protein n=1 Tax=Nyssa sinensis TaxID=561372 RepID=A0A5J4ZCN2_9ASTE|nr:hypothetical protein F0562_016676 [Nyssa sinensis]
MALVPMNSIEHFTHPGHPLEELHAGTEFLCDGCKTLGTGKRYRCHGCDFDMHEYCGRCPRSLSSFMHPHPLTLVVRKMQGTRQNERFCDVCGEFVEGLFYGCKDCEFDVHPLCTQLPQHLRHALHTIHPLMLQTSSSSPCAVCGDMCNFWRYRCGICSFDIHVECVLTPCDHPPTQRTIPPCHPPPPPQPLLARPPHYGTAYAYGVSSGPPNPYNMYNHVNHVQPCGPPPPHYGAYAYRSAGPSLYNMYSYVNQPSQPHDGAAAYNGVPSGPSLYNTHNYVNQADQEGDATHGRKRKKMYAIVRKLTFGVLSNAIFGMDFFSFI